MAKRQQITRENISRLSRDLIYVLLQLPSSLRARPQALAGIPLCAHSWASTGIRHQEPHHILVSPSNAGYASYITNRVNTQPTPLA